jgi:7-cyano-7-deazaguanine reductase
MADNKTQRSKEELDNLVLGSSDTEYPTNYDPSLLEFFENKNPKARAWTSFICTEFTSLCPKTNQPDFARVYINYIAGEKMVESKSMKLYLFSFRNHGGFHEDCMQTICNDLSELIQPHYLEVIGEFTPRGGIAIYPFCQYSDMSDEYQQLKRDRLKDYAPGKFTMPLSKVY